MTERLRAAVDSMARSAVQLPEDVQDKLAEELETALENALWDAQLRDPEHLAVLRALAEEAMQEPSLPFPAPKDMGDEDLDSES
jgi:hypothetical protein